MEQELYKISAFWLFFEAIAAEISNNPEDIELIARIDQEVSKLGEISWEYGSDGDDDFYFSLSPNFRFELIAYTDFIVSLSPNISRWRFISGKPQKLELIEEFAFINEDGTEIPINTKNWYVISYKFEDGTYDIDVILDTNLDIETNCLALKTAMINLLGEINYLRIVNEVKIVEKFDSNVRGKGIPFKHLVKVLK